VVQPQAECVLDHTVDKGGALPGGEALLGLAGKLGIGHLGRQHIGAAVPDIIGGQLDAPGDQFAKLTEFANGGQQAGTKSVDVGAALGGGDEVDVAFGDGLAAFGLPYHGPRNRFTVAIQPAHEGFVGDQFDSPAARRPDRLSTRPRSTIVLLAAGFIGKGDRQSRTEHRFGPQGVAQPPGGEPDRVEIGGLGQKRINVPVLRWPTVPVTSSSCCFSRRQSR
jgi:hypothetical protein